MTSHARKTAQAQNEQLHESSDLYHHTLKHDLLAKQVLVLINPDYERELNHAICLQNHKPDMLFQQIQLQNKE